MGKRLDQAVYQKINMVANMCMEIFNIINHYRNANENQNETQLHLLGCIK